MLLDFPGRIRRRILHYLLICLIMALTISPVTIRNYFSSSDHRFVLTNTNGGITFWIGNNPSSTGMFEFSKKLSQQVKAEMKATGQSYGDMVARYIREHPVDYLKLEWQKCVMFWRGYEIGNNLQYYASRSLSRILKLPWINFVLIGPLGIVGMGLALKRWRARLMLYGFVGVQFLTTLLFFALARYRLPAVPVLSMFAGYALTEAIRGFQQKQWGKLGIILGLFLLLYVAINYPYAAELYQAYYGHPMPLSRLLRYWDLFFIYHTGV
jgi:hypothetical protein